MSIEKRQTPRPQEKDTELVRRNMNSLENCVYVVVMYLANRPEYSTIEQQMTFEYSYKGKTAELSYECYTTRDEKCSE